MPLTFNKADDWEMNEDELKKFVLNIDLPSEYTRLPAEWEKQSGILIAWPHKDTDWNYMLNEVQECFKKIASEIINEEILVIVSPNINDVKEQLKDLYQDHIIYVEIPTNDTWARDFGGITVENNGGFTVLDYKFNGWGSKFASQLDNQITSALFSKKIFKAQYSDQLDFVLEGGSIDSDGNGTILTTSQCLLSKNRNNNLSKLQIEERLKKDFGASHILWLDYGALAGDDTDSHIDTLARLAPHDTILYVGCDNFEDSNFEDLRKMEDQLKSMVTTAGNPYNLIKLPSPDPIYDEDEKQLPATYANFLIMNNKILLPIYNQEKKDELAKGMLKIAFPDYEIVGIDCNPLIKQHGSLHCVTMQFPKQTIIYGE